jgi:sugar fermentation stimulation protein A
VVQRMDCERFDTAGDLDPTYHAALHHAFQAGVEVLCYGCEIDTTGVRLGGRIRWRGASEG